MISVMTEEALGQKIRRARQQLRWSQRRLASEVGVSLWTIGRWERGDTRPHYEGDIDALEAALGISLDEPTAAVATDPLERALKSTNLPAATVRHLLVLWHADERRQSA